MLFRIYQKLISPALHLLLFPLTGSIHACRFTPTCSEYTRQAIHSCGIIHGSYLSLKRILRCNPFSKGGFDPLPIK